MDVPEIHHCLVFIVQQYKNRFGMPATISKEITLCPLHIFKRDTFMDIVITSRMEGGFRHVDYSLWMCVLHRKPDQSLRSEAHIFCLYVSKEIGVLKLTLLWESNFYPRQQELNDFFLNR